VTAALASPGSLPRLGRAAPAALAVSLICLPVATSLQVLDAARDGSGGDAYVGVTARGGHPDETFTVSSPSIWGGTPQMSPAVAQIAEAARQHGGGENGTPLFVTDSWALSSQVIDATGSSVLTDGGYSGHVPVFTTDDLEQMVQNGHVRVFVVASGAPEGDPVRRVATGPGCHEVKEWDFSQSKEGGEINKVTGATLYQCTGG